MARATAARLRRSWGLSASQSAIARRSAAQNVANLRLDRAGALDAALDRIVLSVARLGVDELGPEPLVARIRAPIGFDALEHLLQLGLDFRRLALHVAAHGLVDHPVHGLLQDPLQEHEPGEQLGLKPYRRGLGHGLGHGSARRALGGLASGPSRRSIGSRR